MTDNEIIKALECCMKGNNCGGCCPYDDEDDTCEECTSKLTKDALDLLLRQKAEIDDLKVGLDAMRGAANSYKMHYEEAQAEIERLNEYISRCKSGEEYLVKCLLERPNEAIKEFAERLKNIYLNDKRYDRPNPHTLLIKLFDNIDTLVKEMTEDGK